jgi:hypothetical protein
MAHCKRLVVAALAAAPLVVVAATPSLAKKCVMAGGQGTGVTTDVAKFMATAALNNSIAGAGLKAAGDVKYDCKYEVVVSNCTAKQRACK